MVVTILSHIIAALYLQKQKYKKLVTACFWGAYAIFAVCIMVFQENVMYGFFSLLFMHAVIFFITTIGSLGEKTFLFLTYSNSFCICIGANLILSDLLSNNAHISVYGIGIVVLMHLFLYKILLPSYQKARVFFSSGWWKLNVILVFFFIQFLNQYAFSIDMSNARNIVFDFVIFSIIFYLTLILIFNLVKDSAEMNKKTYENDELKNVAYTDALTNMKNRAAYEKFVRRQVIKHRNNAGAIFIGEYSSEPLGDYFAGPNHVLPTNGTAKFFSPLSVDDFIKKSSIISYSREALQPVYKDIVQFAESEQLTAHANSIRVRFE